jgi:hypothetical protein
MLIACVVLLCILKENIGKYEFDSGIKDSILFN